MGQSPEPKPKVPLWKILLRWGEGLSILGGLGTAARWFLKAVAGVSIVTTILTSPFAIYTYGLLIIVGGLLIGGAVIRYGYEQSQRSPSPTPAPTATVTSIPTPTLSPTPTHTPTPTPSAPSAPAAKPPPPRPGVTANVIRHRSVTEHLHTDDGGPGAAKPPSPTAAKSPASQRATPATPPPVVEVRPAGRVLTDEQRAILGDRLAAISGHDIGVWADMNDDEAKKFADQLLTVLKSLGFNDPTSSGWMTFAAHPPPLTVQCWTTAPVKEDAREVQDALVLRGALIAANLLTTDAKVAINIGSTLTGKTHFASILVGPRTAVSQ